jgi:hypothetical protein
MPKVWFETKIPVFGQGKTVHGLDRGAIVIGVFYIYFYKKVVKIWWAFSIMSLDTELRRHMWLM